MFDNVKKNFGFGCMRLPMQDGDVDTVQFSAMVDRFIEAGFNYFDTAHGYIDGKSEKAVRTCLTSRYPRDAYVLANKLSGWFFEKESDVKSEHVYFKRLNLKKDSRPLVLSEFGGYSCVTDGHIFNPSNNYGYKTLKTSGQLTEALKTLYLEQIVPEIKNKGLCAAVYTQVSDVEDETNGLLTYDREILKVNPDRIKKLMDELYAEIK